MICVLNNLEILGTSENAKRAFETLRDDIFNINGIRWVCSGAQGVIRGLWRSGRMNGYFCPPIVVSEIKEEDAHFLYEKRGGSLQESRQRISPDQQIAIPNTF